MTYLKENFQVPQNIYKYLSPKNLIRSKNDLNICLLLFINKIQLDIAAYLCLKYYGYYPIFENNLNLYSYLSSWFIFLISIPIQLKIFKGRNLSNIVLGLLLLFSFNPQIVMMGYRPDYPIAFAFSMFSYWITLFLAYFGIKTIKFKSIGAEFGRKTIFYISLFLSTIVIYYSYRYTNFRFTLNLYDVYLIRAEAREYGSLGFLNYFLSFADNVLPFLSIYFFHKKNHFFSAFLLFIVILNFSITGTKQILFLYIIGILGYFFIKKTKDIYKLILASNLILFGSIIEKTIFVEQSARSIFFVHYPFRLLFLPVEFHHQFFQFFSINPSDFFRQSFLRFFIDSPYTTGIHFLLGEFTIGDIQARANNGLYSDAFLNLSYFGVIIFPILTILIFKIFDGMITRLEERLWFVIAIYMAMVILNVPLVNALANSGLILLFLLLRTLKLKKIQ